MNFAQLPIEERQTFIAEAAARLGVSEVLVEKDFWVCWTLARIFGVPEIAPHLVFKGGTSLSKVFNAIKRFSEDIDLSISPGILGVEESTLWEAPSKKQRQQRVEALEIACIAYVRDDVQPKLRAAFRDVLNGYSEQWELRFELDGAVGSPNLLFSYPSAGTTPVSYFRKSVKLEFGSLCDQIPFDKHAITPLIQRVIDEPFDDFEILVIALEFGRTFWEKATILHAENHRPTDRPFRDRIARHYSDFAALWSHPLAGRAVENREMLRSVVRHKQMFFPSGWASYDTAQSPTMRLVPPKRRLRELETDYLAMQEMFLKAPPGFALVVEELQRAEIAINSS
ncbi:MAG: nucleotidyl transferase AbiEii/AbiGii toxin family protein [Dehalococcoidia bacterium]